MSVRLLLREKTDGNISSSFLFIAARYAELLGIKNASYVKFSGMTKMEDGTVETEVEMPQNFARKEINEYADYKKRAAEIQAAYRKAAEMATANKN